MKKGIEVWTDYDRCSQWVLYIGKKKGKLSLEDIRKAATEYDENIYCMVLNCLPDIGEQDYFSETFGFEFRNNDGTTTHYDDVVMLYDATSVWKQ